MPPNEHYVDSWKVSLCSSACFFALLRNYNVFFVRVLGLQTIHEKVFHIYFVVYHTQAFWPCQLLIKPDSQKYG